MRVGDCPPQTAPWFALLTFTFADMGRSLLAIVK